MAKRTPLFEEHRKLGAMFTEFAGWEMPLYYTGIKEEHMAVRKNAGVFDVSHMGDIWIEGNDAADFVSYLTTANPRNHKIGSCMYAHILNENGRILDDTIITKVGENRYLCVPNAATKDMILNWFRDHTGEMDVRLTDVTDDYVCIAFQGPKAAGILQGITEGFDFGDLKFFKARFLSVTEKGLGDVIDFENVPADQPIKKGVALVSRTGYTGEDGFEIITVAEDGVFLWNRILDAGEDSGVLPAGLGARDTLRLEKGFLLSGTDFNGEQTTLETGWDFIIEWDHDFIGKEALLRQKEEGIKRILRGFVLKEKSIPRHGNRVFLRKDDEKEVATVTSGSFSPVLEKGIGMAYLPVDVKKGSSIWVEIHGKRREAEVVKPPFVK